MKLLEKSKYTLVGVTLGLGLVGLTAYAATQTGTIGSLFNSISGDENGNPVSNEYRLDGKNIQDNTITNYEIDNTDDFVVNSLQVTSEPSGDNDVVTKGYLSDNYMSTIDGDLVVPGKLSVNGGDFSGDYSVALGRYTKSSGDYSVALGRYTRANGENSVSIGHYNFANGKYSMALGYYTQADGAYSTVIGKGYVGDEDYYLINDKPNSFAVGYMNSSTDTIPELIVEDGKISLNSDTSINGNLKIGDSKQAIFYSPKFNDIGICYSSVSDTPKQYCIEQGYDNYVSYDQSLIKSYGNCIYYSPSLYKWEEKTGFISNYVYSQIVCSKNDFVEISNDGKINISGDLEVAGDINGGKNYSVHLKTFRSDLLDNKDDYSYLAGSRTSIEKVTQRSSLSIEFLNSYRTTCNVWTNDADEKWVQNFDLLNDSTIGELSNTLGSNLDSVKEIFSDLCMDEDGCDVRVNSYYYNNSNPSNNGYVNNTSNIHLSSGHRRDLGDVISYHVTGGTVNFAYTDFDDDGNINPYQSVEIHGWNRFRFINQRWPNTDSYLPNGFYLHVKGDREGCYFGTFTFID